MSSPAGRTALLLGATGETGKELLKCLLANDHYAKIITVGRKNAADPADPRLEQRLVDFENLQPDSFREADVAFCCLGTTRGKAGRDGFVRVDKDYVLNSAEILKQQGCRDFHLLTSKGANPDAFLLYPKVKGEVEAAVKALGFERTCIYKPGLLMCEREESRPMESVLRRCFSWFDGQAQTFSVKTQHVAKAMMLNSLRKTTEAVEVLEHADIVKMAGESDK